MTAKNCYGVPKATWKKWTLGAQLIYNLIYSRRKDRYAAERGGDAFPAETVEAIVTKLAAQVANEITAKEREKEEKCNTKKFSVTS